MAGSGRAATPRAVVVHRTSELTELLARHGTRGQVAFFLDFRNMNLDLNSIRGDFCACHMANG